MWFGLTQRTINDDDGISILAAQGIPEHGIPRLPSGFIYERGVVPHYLLAASIGSLGLGDLSIMLPSLLLGLGSLWLVYLFARDIMGNRWIGVAAVALLLVLQVHTLYATSPRMYMTLQFMTLLAAYSAWRGYFQGSRRFQMVTLLAIAAAMLSHKQGAVLVVAIPISVLIVTWITRQKMPSVHAIQNLGGVLVIALAGFFLLVYGIPDGKGLIAFHGGQEPDHLGLNLNPAQWTNLAFASQRIFPFGLSFLPLAIFLAAKTVLGRRADPHLGLTYALLIFGAGGLAVLIIVNLEQGRFWLFLLPFNALIVCASVAALLEHFRRRPETRVQGDVRRRPKKRSQGNSGRRAKARVQRNFAAGVVLLSFLAGGAAANLGFVFVGRGADEFKQIVTDGYGPPCTISSSDRPWIWCSNQESAYATIRQEVKPEDLIISTNPWLTNYYLGRVDGLLREKREGVGGFTSFDRSTEEYFGITLIDTLDELLQLAEEDKRVWVLLDGKTSLNSSQQTTRFVDAAYHRLYDDRSLLAYVNCLEPPCGQHSEGSLLARLEGYNEAIRLDPRDAVAYYNRGIVYAELGLTQKAIMDFGEAIRLDPRDAVSYYRRGIVYADLGLEQKAIMDFGEAIRLNPQFAPAYNHRAVVRSRLNELETAIDDLDEAVRLDSRFSKAYENRAVLYVKLGESQAALNDIEQAIHLDPQSAKAYRIRALAKTLLGRDTAAQKDVERAVELGIDAAALAKDIEELKQRR